MAAAAATPAPHGAAAQPPPLLPPDANTQVYVLLHNVSKKHNVGTLARSCTAFNVNTLVLTGTAHYNVFGCQGSSTSPHEPQ